MPRRVENSRCSPPSRCLLILSGKSTSKAIASWANATSDTRSEGFSKSKALVAAAFVSRQGVLTNADLRLMLERLLQALKQSRPEEPLGAAACNRRN